MSTATSLLPLLERAGALRGGIPDRDLGDGARLNLTIPSLRACFTLHNPRSLDRCTSP